MANTPAVKVFTKEMAIAGSLTSAFDVSQTWEKIYLQIPTMIAKAITATCGVKILASDSEDGTYSEISLDPNRSNPHKTDDRPGAPLFQVCANSAGVSNAVTDASLTTHTFFVGPSAGEEYHIERLIVSYGDTTGWRADGYAGATPSLPSGIEIYVVDGEESPKVNLTASSPIVNNVGWGKQCYDFNYQNFGVGNDFGQVRWSFFKAGDALRLNGDAGDRFVIYHREDMSFMDTNFYTVQGSVHTNPPSVSRMVEVPAGFRYYKVETTCSMTAAATFKLICSD